MFSQAVHTPAEVIIQLQSRGFEYDFLLEEKGLYCVQSHDHLAKKEYTIEECYHFPESSVNDSFAVIYGISCTGQLQKGILLCRLKEESSTLYWQLHRNYLLPVQDNRDRISQKEILPQ
jgi:hypothetical protein